MLPRFSSADFAPEDLAKPFLDVVLEPGDLLYMPRGIQSPCTLDSAVAVPLLTHLSYCGYRM